MLCFICQHCLNDKVLDLLDGSFTYISTEPEFDANLGNDDGVVTHFLVG